MSGESATVEVLTAEVRVLMVGNRQVTLSVFRQLDWVKPDMIVPFGRIRDRVRNQHTPPAVTVVGRHRQSGALVKSDAEEFPQYGMEEDRLAERRTSDRWKQLPLIVLAGLR